MEVTADEIKLEPLDAHSISGSETTPFSLPQKRYSDQEASLTVEGDVDPSCPTRQETSLTIWHIYTVFLCIIGHFMEAFGSHGLSALVAKDYIEGQGSLVLLSITASIPVFCTLILLPQCLYIFNQFPLVYRFSGAIGFTLIAVAYVSSAFVPTHLLFLITYSLPFGVGSAFILASTSQLSHGYFPQTYPHRFIINLCIAIGFPLGAATGPIAYARFLQTSGKSYNKKLFWFFIAMAAGNFLLAWVTAIFLKPKEQTLCSALQSLQRTEVLEEQKSPRSKSSTSRQSMQKPCSSYFQLLLMFERHLMCIWLVSEVICGALWFALRVCFMIYVMANYSVTLRPAAVFLCVFAAGQGCIILGATLLGSRLRRVLPLIHLVSSLGLCVVSALIIYLRIPLTWLYVCAFSLGVFTQLSLSFSYTNAEKIMRIGFGNSFVITASALGLGVLLSVLVGGLIVIHPTEPRLFFFVQMGGWAFNTALHCVLCATYYLGKWCR